VLLDSLTASAGNLARDSYTSVEVLTGTANTYTTLKLKHFRCWACESEKYFTTSRARMLGPEKWRTISAQAEVIGNFDGRSQRFWRANRSCEAGIGAKDQSSHLVAGSLWSFPQDSDLFWIMCGKEND